VLASPAATSGPDLILTPECSSACRPPEGYGWRSGRSTFRDPACRRALAGQTWRNHYLPAV